MVVVMLWVIAMLALWLLLDERARYARSLQRLHASEAVKALQLQEQQRQLQQPQEHVLN